MHKSAPAFALGVLLASSSAYADQITFGPSTQDVKFTGTATGLAVSARQLDFPAFDTINTGLGAGSIAGLDFTTGPESGGIFTANSNSATFQYAAANGDALIETIHVTTIQDSTEQPKVFFSGDAPSSISGGAAFLAAFSGPSLGDWINDIGVVLDALRGSAAATVSAGELKFTPPTGVSEPSMIGIFGLGLLVISWWHSKWSRS